MFKTLYEIGKYICDQEGKDPLTLSLREQFESFGATKEIAIQLAEKNEKVEFKDVRLGEIDIENSGKYGALGTTKQGANLLLFFIFDGKVAQKTHLNRKKSTGKEIPNIIVGFEDNFINFFDKTDTYGKCLNKNVDIIIKQLLNIDFSEEEKYLLTLTVNKKYPNEIKDFKKYLFEEEKIKNFNKN